MKTTLWRRRRPATGSHVWSSLLAAAAGAGLMYFLDPQAGATRRARARQRSARGAHRSRAALSTAGRDLAHRTRGLAHQVAGTWTEKAVDDEILCERVRAELGHVCSHPGAIQVSSRGGIVALTGHILRPEQRRLIRRLRRVPGVQRIEDGLDAHDPDTNLPALQDGEPRGQRHRAWSPARRSAVGVTGASLAFAGWRLGRPGLGVIGLALAVRGVVNLPLRALFGIGTGRPAFDVDKTLHVAARPEDVFSFWQALEQFPRFMTHVKEVQKLSDRRYRWTVEGPGALPISWEAEITALVPGELIAWRSVQGAPVRTSGVVHFAPEDGGTLVQVRMKYSPPAGAVGHALARLFGAHPRKQMDDDLLRFKSLLEQGKATGSGETVTREQLLPAGR
jgi:uncharacterized membrane protein